MGVNLVLQWLGMALVAVGLTALFGWPVGVIVMGVGILLVGVAGEVGGSALDDRSADVG